MTEACLGQVVSATNDRICVRDLETQDVYEVNYVFDPERPIGTDSTGVFVFSLSRGIRTLVYLSLRKFLNPLGEDDLITKAGAWTTIGLIDDPFPEMYDRILTEESEPNPFESSDATE